MSSEITEIVAGNSYYWYEYPSVVDTPSSYKLIYTLIGPSRLVFSGSIQSDNTSFYVSLTPTQTTSLTAGIYNLTGFMSSSTERVTHSETTVQVSANPDSTVVGTEQRSHARKTLALIESAIETVAQGGVISLSIAGRSRTNYSLGELLKLRSYYQSEVEAEEKAERIAKGITGESNMIFVRF